MFVQNELDVEIQDVKGPPRFYHTLKRKDSGNFDKIILGDSVVFGVAKMNCITYCFPGAKIEDLLMAPNLIKTPEISKVCIYIGTNNFLGSRTGKYPPDTPEEAFEKYKLIIRNCILCGLKITICPLFGLEGKKEEIQTFNNLLKTYAQEHSYGFLKIKNVHYSRDIGNINKNEMRDGIHPTVKGVSKVASCFSF